MRLVDPVAAPAAPPVKAAPLIKKGKVRRARRISTPMAASVTDIETPRVITQDSTLSTFSVPLARPEEAQQKTLDVTQAQHGEDEGDSADSAAQVAAAARAGQQKAEEEAAAHKLADDKREADKRAAELAAELAEREKAQEAAQLKQAEQTAARLREQQLVQQKIEHSQLEQQEAERAARLRAEQLQARERAQAQLAERQRAEQVQAAQLQAEQERQRAEQLKLEQRRLAEQKAEQQKAEQQKAEQLRAEQQQRAEQQRAEQQRAEQQRAEQQRADQQRAEREAAQQRARDLASALPGAGGQGGPAAGSGGGGTAQIPKNMLGSDLGNRARELVKGLDLLRGAPPGVRRAGDRRAVVSYNERDLPLKMYVESWRQKVERNGALNYPRSWVDAVRIDPVVSVAVRSDGSVEDVVIVSSSGRADMDEAVRRIVRVNARYSPFPPQIAERYDVIEIRRVWRFDDALKLMEELH